MKAGVDGTKDEHRARVNGKTVLVVTYHFPPGRAVGGLRWAGLGKHLAGLGWCVHVLTSGSDEEEGEEAGDGVVVHRVPRRDTLNDSYKRWAGKRREVAPRSPRLDQTTTSARAAARADIRPSLVRRLRTEISAWLAFPDEARGWVFSAARRTRRLCREMGADVLVSSGPPHSAHIAAAVAAMGLGIPHLLDLRDPWTRPFPEDRKESLSPSALARGAKGLLERLVFRQAAGIVTNTAEFADFLRQELALPFEVISIPNGIDLERLPADAGDAYPGLSIAYVGTLYFGRDIGPVLQAMVRFFDRFPTARAAGSRLRIAGTMADAAAARLHSQIAELKLDDDVELLGVLSPPDAMRVLGRSSLAVVLAQNQEFQVPAKIYESVGLGIPTLVVTDPESATGREAARIGASVASATEVDSMVEAMARLWQGSEPSRRPPREPIDYGALARPMSHALSRMIGDSC